jgi:hypothetical protein
MDATTVQKIVDRVSVECFEAHRGAFWWDEDERIGVVFGNDGYSSDERSQGEVDAIRWVLETIDGIGLEDNDREHRELACATGNDGYSWVLICRLGHKLDISHLKLIIWTVWGVMSKQKAAGEFMTWDEATYLIDDIITNSDDLEEVGVQANIASAVLERNGLL